MKVVGLFENSSFTLCPTPLIVFSPDTRTHCPWVPLLPLASKLPLGKDLFSCTFSLAATPPRAYLSPRKEDFALIKEGREREAESTCSEPSKVLVGQMETEARCSRALCQLGTSEGASAFPCQLTAQHQYQLTGWPVTRHFLIMDVLLTHTTTD